MRAKLNKFFTTLSQIGQELHSLFCAIIDHPATRTILLFGILDEEFDGHAGDHDEYKYDGPYQDEW